MKTFVAIFVILFFLNHANGCSTSVLTQCSAARSLHNQLHGSGIISKCCCNGIPPINTTASTRLSILCGDVNGTIAITGLHIGHALFGEFNFSVAKQMPHVRSLMFSSSNVTGDLSAFKALNRVTFEMCWPNVTFAKKSDLQLFSVSHWHGAFGEQWCALNSIERVDLFGSNALRDGALPACFWNLSIASLGINNLNLTALKRMRRLESLFVDSSLLQESIDLTRVVSQLPQLRSLDVHEGKLMVNQTTISGGALQRLFLRQMSIVVDNTNAFWNLIDSLPKLTDLLITKTQFVVAGTIKGLVLPESAPHWGRNISSLVIDECYGATLPTWVLAAPRLQSLTLSTCNFSRLAAPNASMPVRSAPLKQLTVYNNRLIELPLWLPYIVMRLSAPRNNLTVWPSEWRDLHSSALVKLDLSENQLREFVFAPPCSTLAEYFAQPLRQVYLDHMPSLVAVVVPNACGMRLSARGSANFQLSASNDKQMLQAGDVLLRASGTTLESFGAFSCNSPVAHTFLQDSVAPSEPWVLEPRVYGYVGCACKAGFFGIAPVCQPCPRNCHCEGAGIGVPQNHFALLSTPTDTDVPIADIQVDAVSCNSCRNFTRAVDGKLECHNSTCDAMFVRFVPGSTPNTMRVFNQETLLACIGGGTGRLCSRCRCNEPDSLGFNDSQCYFKSDKGCDLCVKQDRWKAWLSAALALFVFVAFCIVDRWIAMAAITAAVALMVALKLVSIAVMGWAALLVYLTRYTNQSTQIWRAENCDDRDEEELLLNSTQMPRLIDINDERSQKFNVSVLGATKILIYFVQVVAVVNESSWPQKWLLAEQSFRALVFARPSFGLACLFDGWLTFDRNLLLHLLAPLGSALLVTMTLGVRHVLLKRSDSAVPRKDLLIGGAVLAIVNLQYFGLVELVFSMFAFKPQVSFESDIYLAAAPWIARSSAQYGRVLVYAIAGLLLLVIGFPALVLSLLRARRRTLNSAATRQLLGFFYEDYRRGAAQRWGETFYTLRRLLLSATLAVMPRSNPFRMPVFVALVLAFMTASANFRLRRLRDEEHLDALASIVFVLNAAAFQSVAVDAISVELQFPALFWATWTLTGAVACVLLFAIIKAIVAKLRSSAATT